MFLLATEAITAILAMSGISGLIFSTVYAWKLRHNKRRQAEMEAIGRDLDLTLLPNDSLGLVKQLQQFDLFARERTAWRRGGRISNILRGQIDHTSVYMFDYTYVISTGKSTRTITQTVFFADDKDWCLPEFKLKPETWWHKVLKKIGWESDVEFADSEEFSEKFWVKSEIEQLVREKFTPELQQFLLERPPVHLEGSNYYLIAYKPNKVLSKDEARAYFKHCSALVVMLKKEGKTELLDLAEWQKEKLIAPPDERRDA